MRAHLDHVRKDVAEARPVIPPSSADVSDALAGDQHIGERAGHRQTAIVGGVVQDQDQSVTRILRAQLCHGAALIAGDDQMLDVPMPLERFLQQRYPLGTVARAGK